METGGGVRLPRAGQVAMGSVSSNGVSVYGYENVLELDGGGGCTIL